MAVYEQEWVVAKALQASENMTTVMRIAVGVNGQAVLVQTTAGVVITRSGGHILNIAFSPSDPVFSLLLNSATELHKSLGDGVKTYVIFLNNLLRFIKFKNVRQFLFKLLVFEAKLQDCFSSLTCCCVLTNNVLSNVIKTFFFTRFTSIVSEELSKVVLEWVTKLPFILDISFYLYNFKILCLKFSPFPLFSSKVQSGILLQGIHPRRLPLNFKNCFVKVYYRNLNITPDASEIEMDIVEIIKQSNEKCMNTLFVTNIVLQENALFLLNLKNIYVIHSVSSDLVKFLFDKSTNLGGLLVEYCYVNELLWISIEGVYQLLIKAPNTILATEYADNILDCLKMLHFSFKQSYCIVPTGGAFYQAFANQLFLLNKGIGPKLPPVVNREQILNWATAGIESDFLSHINIKSLEGIDSEVLEMFCKAILSTISVKNKSDHLEPLVLNLTVLLKAVNTVIGILRLDGTTIKEKREEHGKYTRCNFKIKGKTMIN